MSRYIKAKNMKSGKCEAYRRRKKRKLKAQGAKLNVERVLGHDLANAPTHVPTRSAITGAKMYRAN
jgi:hypothetical protein